MRSVSLVFLALFLCFSVNGGNHHLFVALWTSICFFKYVVSLLKVSYVLELALLAQNGRDNSLCLDGKFESSFSCLKQHVD